MNRRTAQRREFVQSLGFSPEDATAFGLKFKWLKGNGPARGTLVEMEFEDYVTLAAEAGLQGPQQIGRGLDKFQLGRVNDEGSYKRGNCRFITQRLNLEEQRQNMARRAQA